MAAALARLEDHPVLRAVGLFDGLGDVAFAAIWVCFVLIEAFVSLLMRCGIYAVEILCVALDWAGAVY